MAKISFAFIAGTLLTIFAAGSVLMGLFSAVTKTVSNEASEVAANFSWTFLNTTILLVILIVAVLLLTGKKLVL